MWREDDEGALEDAKNGANALRSGQTEKKRYKRAAPEARDGDIDGKKGRGSHSLAVSSIGMEKDKVMPSHFGSSLLELS